MSLIAFVLIMALILAAGPWVVPRIAASIRRESIVADHSFAGRRTSRAPAFARIAPPGVGAAPRFGFAAYA